MEVFIDLEKLLLKIVSISPEGVDYQDIIKYQKIVLENCYDQGIVAIVSPGVSQNELERVVMDYDELFIMSCYPHHKYYSFMPEFNYFDGRNSEIINKILGDSLIEYQNSNDKSLALIRKNEVV